VSDYQTFLNDLSSGSYVENSVDTVMLDNDGKRLMCEALYLLGVMLLFMDLRIPGPIREVLIIAHFRHKV
jgi:WASH complex subunit strumpellin